ncbi:MAG TPA: VOC family protein [Microlunatus sp.]|nr:VOC family protein [Microlunatus sp.]
MISWLTAFLDCPGPAFAETVRFWQRATGSGLSAYRGDQGEFATLIPPDGDPYLRTQLIESGTAGSHLDLHVTDVFRAGLRAQDLGARITREEPGLIVAVSPGGFPFCLVSHHGERIRSLPYGRPGSLVDQLCLDIPEPRYDEEARFWSELTGWRHRPGSRPEFGYLARPPDQPLRILLQRTGDPAAAPVRAHLDLACADREAETVRHKQLGAVPVSEGPHWTTLTDPSGRAYCLTDRDPVTGRLTLPSPRR